MQHIEEAGIHSGDSSCVLPAVDIPQHLLQRMVFLMMGAWPVLGFFGVDALAIWWAFRINNRTARACEEITMTPSELRVRRTSHRGHDALLVTARSARGPDARRHQAHLMADDLVQMGRLFG